MAGPYIFNIDLILEAGKVDSFKIIDFNGSRGSLDGFEILYQGDKILRQVLEILNSFGDKGILSLSQKNSSPVQQRFNSDVIQKALADNGGIYNGFEMYVPIGEPYSMAGETKIENCAKGLGITYNKGTIEWYDNRFFINYPNGEKILLRDMEVNGIVWPYSLDQRNIHLPFANLVNPAPIYSLTNNKLLFSTLCKLNGLETIESFLCGFNEGSAKHLDFINLLEGNKHNSENFVIKPNNSLRSFGVMVAATKLINQVLNETNLFFDEEYDLERLRQGLILSLLWGDISDLLVIAQPYIESQIAIHPITKLPHRTKIRAVIIFHNNNFLLFDAYQVLLAQSRNNNARTSFISSDQNFPIITKLPEFQHESLKEYLLSFIRKLLQGLVTFNQEEDILKNEMDFMARQLTEETDIDILEMWENTDYAFSLKNILSDYSVV